MSHSVFVASSICLHWVLVLPLFLGFLAYYNTHIVAFNSWRQSHLSFLKTNLVLILEGQN